MITLSRFKCITRTSGSSSGSPSDLSLLDTQSSSSSSQGSSPAFSPIGMTGHFDFFPSAESMFFADQDQQHAHSSSAEAATWLLLNQNMSESNNMLDGLFSFSPTDYTSTSPDYISDQSMFQSPLGLSVLDPLNLMPCNESSTLISQGLQQDSSSKTLTLYGSKNCVSTARIQIVLHEKQVPYTLITDEDVSKRILSQEGGVSSLFGINVPFIVRSLRNKLDHALIIPPHRTIMALCFTRAVLFAAISLQNTQTRAPS